MAYTTRCHCGAIRIEMSRRIRQLTRCNCSICRRYGALWAYQQRIAIDVKADARALGAYSWGDRALEFYFCADCGCITHYHHVDQRHDGSDMSAVNMRNVVDPALVADLPIRLFDGADSWKVLGKTVERHLLMSPVRGK